MSNKWPAAVVLIAVFTALVVSAAPALAEVNVGDKAPDFTLNDLNGSKITLSEFCKHPTLVVFWVSWCPHCRAELPVIQKIYTDLKDKGMSVLGVNVDGEIESAKRLVKDSNITFPSVYALTDEGKKVLDAYDIHGVPTIFVLDKDRTITAKYIGEEPEQTLRDDLAKLGVK